ncbi:hydrogenase maturation nickel metallochaperone HypA [bacterium]|nr:hydrogenase maturation nickel metallochaperone HypA [bacterium]
MHEFSICQNLVDAIVNEVNAIQPLPKRLLKVHVALGHLRQIIPEYLQFAYEVLIKDTVAEGSELLVRTVPLEVKCRKCQWQGEIERQAFICKSCGSTELEMLTGMELYLENLEIEVEDAEGN